MLLGRNNKNFFLKIDYISQGREIVLSGIVLLVAAVKPSYTSGYSYHLGDKKLERVTAEQDLGIWIMQEWNTQVECMTAKAKKMLNALYCSCKDISDLSKTKKLLYITWVRSHLEYASVVWSNWSNIGQLSLLLDVIYPVTTSNSVSYTYPINVS